MKKLKRVILGSIKIPPLRERKEDIPLITLKLFDEIKAECDSRVNKEFSREALGVIQDHQLPGNLRQIQGAIRHAIIGDHYWITPEHLNLSDGLNINSTVVESSAKMGRKLITVPDYKIKEALYTASGNQRKAARLLSISYSTFRRRLKEAAIE